MENVYAAEHALVTYAIEQMQDIEGLKLLGPRDNRTGLASFILGNVHPHDISAALDSLGIAIRAGHHCAQPLHERFGVPATARASFYLYNTREEVDILVAGLRKVAEYFSF
jgi:cysteine desulfurase / selenocysteine lyase